MMLTFGYYFRIWRPK